jgi:hypothetical protein
MSSTASPQSRAPGVGAAISVRRFANDEIARVGSSLDDLGEGHRFEFLCECGDLSCSQFAKMTVAEYRASSPGSVVAHPVPGGILGPLASRRPTPDADTLAAANAHIYRHVRDSDDGEQEWEFLCECGRDDCDERVLLTIDAYIALHDQGAAVLADGHQRSEVERARALCEDAEALKSQAVQQVKRARSLRSMS